MVSEPPTRVVVADDSALMRRIISSALARAGVDVVAEAADGDEALAACEHHRPDALMLDLSMPGLDGIGVLRALRRAGGRPLPVIVVSAFSPAQGARAVDALAEGAFDLVAKPRIGESLDGFAETLVRKLRAATDAGPNTAKPTPPVAPASRAIRSSVTRAVLIATSTGGPKALAAVLPKLPSRLGLGTLIVQHMPPGFTRSLAARLDQSSQLTVREASGGEMLDPSVALLAPGGRHLRLAAGGRVTLSDEPEVGALRPRADLMIRDAAQVYGERTLLVVMTGMGNDGLDGAAEIKRRGGRILVEAQSTCTVYGMPRAVQEAALADAAVPLNELPEAIAAEAAA